MARRDFKTTKASTVINIVTKKNVSFDSRELLGERIRYYRKKAGFRQQELAKLLGVSANSVSNWEGGFSRPDLDNVVHMCSTLNITLAQLFGLEEDIPRREKAAMRKYHALNGSNKDLIDLMMDKLIEAQDKARIMRPNLTLLRREFRPLAAGVGDPSEYYDDSAMVYVHTDAIHKHADYVFDVNGNSMEPSYRNGEMVLVQSVQADEMTPGTIGAFQWDNELFIKEYRENGLYSHNQDYPPMLFTDNADVYLIGKVVGTLDKRDIARPEEIELYEAFESDEG